MDTLYDYSKSIPRLTMMFSPGLRLTLFCLLFFPLFVSLGFWQLDRAAQKEALVDAFGVRQTSAPVSLDEALVQPDPNYTRVAIEGRADLEQVVYLENRLRDGRLGVEALLPVEVGQEWLLVNLGWQPLDAGQTPPGFQDFANLPRFQGYLYTADKARFVLSDQPSRLEPLMLPRLDWGLIGQQHERTYLPWQLRLTEGHPLALDTRWTVAVTGPEKHRGYAVQWFAMAVALFILFFVAGLKRND